jgi:hypothetical protein
MRIPVDGLSVEIPTIAVGDPSVFGEWTPVIGGTTETGQVYHFQTGHYIKIGRLVTVWSYTQFSAKGGIVGPLHLKGLPFPTVNLPGFFAGVCSYSSNLSPNAANVSSIMLYTGGTQTVVALFGFMPGQNPRPLTTDDINDHTQLILSLSYPTDA